MRMKSLLNYESKQLVNIYRRYYYINPSNLFTHANNFINALNEPKKHNVIDIDYVRIHVIIMKDIMIKRVKEQRKRI